MIPVNIDLSFLV